MSEAMKFFGCWVSWEEVEEEDGFSTVFLYAMEGRLISLEIQ